VDKPIRDDERVPSIKCPYCPVCGREPILDWVNITPWFCPNNDCRVFGWDPYVSAKVNLENATEIAETIENWPESKKDS
jgi:hypothetical protein